MVLNSNCHDLYETSIDPASFNIANCMVSVPGICKGKSNRNAVLITISPYVLGSL